MSKLNYHIDKLTRNIFRKKGEVMTELVMNWEQIVGDKSITKHCEPVKMTYANKKNNSGTLQIKCSGAFATELSGKENLIKMRVASYFGYNAIDKIKIIHH